MDSFAEYSFADSADSAVDSFADSTADSGVGSRNIGWPCFHTKSAEERHELAQSEDGACVIIDV